MFYTEDLAEGAMTENTYGQIRVLLVDDNAFARSVGRQILKTAGLNAVLEASNGRMALDLAIITLT